ncbi:MAG: hypothetical protein ACK40X_13045, partial [Armatimonadota bacterium]
HENEIHCRSNFSRDEYVTFGEGELPSEPKFFCIFGSAGASPSLELLRGYEMILDGDTHQVRFRRKRVR